MTNTPCDLDEIRKLHSNCHLGDGSCEVTTRYYAKRARCCVIRLADEVERLRNEECLLTLGIKEMDNMIGQLTEQITGYKTACAFRAEPDGEGKKRDGS